MNILSLILSIVCNVNNVFIVLFVFTFYAFSKYYVKNKRVEKLLDSIPGPSPRYSLIGNLDLVWFTSISKDVIAIEQIFTALSVMYNKSGIFKFKVGPQTSVCIFNHTLTKDILKNNINIDKPFEYQLLYEWLGKGLLINNSSALWRERRKLLTPGFHFQILENFNPIINEKSNILLKKLLNSINDDYVDITKLMFPFALDVISETALGIQLNSQRNQNQEYINAVHNMGTLFINRLQNPLLWPNLIYRFTPSGKEFNSNLKILHSMTQRVINERKIKFLENKENKENMNSCENTSNKKRKRLAFLDLLLDIYLKDNSLTLEDIREEVDTFMFAGHDTTAVCLSWTLFLIGLYPEIQLKIQEELESIIDDKERDVTSDDIKHMSYLNAVIKESLRYFSPVPIIVRDLKEDLKLGEYTIPKGISLYLLITRLHMDSDVFADPLVFRPERFLGGEKIPFSFAPFSGGIRNCIGQKLAINEMKIVLTKILLNFNLKSLDQINDIVVYNAIVSKPKYGLKINVSPRL